MKTWSCPKCRHQAKGRKSLDAHFTAAKHHLDRDWDLYRARVRVDAAAEAVDAAQHRLDDAHANLARIEAIA